jgi:RNA-directed DNA polymerase
MRATGSTVDLDLAKFLDKVRPDVLMPRVARKVPDRDLLRLIGRCLRAGVMAGETLQPTQMGIPQ